MFVRLFYSFLGIGLAGVAIGFASIPLGPYQWSERAVGAGGLFLGAAFLTNAWGGIKEKKMRERGGTILTLENGGRILFALNVGLNLFLAAFCVVLAYMFWFHVRAIR
jgi:hypothetical protein